MFRPTSTTVVSQEKIFRNPIITKLPIELSHLIFHYLAVEDINTLDVAFCNHTERPLLMFIFEKMLSPPIITTAAALDWLSLRCPRIRTLDTSNIDFIGFQYQLAASLINSFEDLEAIIAHDYINISDKCILSIDKKICMSLKVIELRNVDKLSVGILSLFISQCLNVEKLYMRCWREYDRNLRDGDSLVQTMAECHKLKSISLYNFRVSSASLLNLSRNNPFLSKLEICNGVGPSGHFDRLDTNFDIMSALTILKLSSSFEPELLVQVLKSCPNLTELVIFPQNHVITIDEIILTTANCCRSLQVLSYNSLCIFRTDIILNLIINELKSLVVFELRNANWYGIFPQSQLDEILAACLESRRVKFIISQGEFEFLDLSQPLSELGASCRESATKFNSYVQPHSGSDNMDDMNYFDDGDLQYSQNNGSFSDSDESCSANDERAATSLGFQKNGATSQDYDELFY